VASDTSSDQTAKTGKRCRYLPVAFSACVWLYTVMVLGVWLVIRFAGDRWWFATVLLFAPRWIHGLPLIVLGPFALVRPRCWLWSLVASAVVVAGPIMGCCFPWARWLPGHGPAMRLLTCNIDGTLANEDLEALLLESGADVVALQEYDSDVQLRWPEGWQVRRVGELLLASRFPIQHTEVSFRRRPPTHWPPVNGLYCLGKYTNAFSSTGFGWGYTKHTPVFAGGEYGLRIDHILCDAAWRPGRCWVGPEVGSDHSPLFATLEWKGP